MTQIIPATQEPDAYDLVEEWQRILASLPFGEWHLWEGVAILEFFFGTRYPRKIRRLINKIWRREVLDAIVAGPRGGGKSFTDAQIEFLLWGFAEFDAVNVGGSEGQARGVYTYLQGFMEQYRENLRELTDLGGHAPSLNLLKETMSHTIGKVDPLNIHRPTLYGPDGEELGDDAFAGPPLAKDNKKFIAVLAASQKQVRGPHAGSEVRGGVLVIDEEAEAEADIVNAAMYMVNTANPRVVLRTSTYHSAVGTFADDFEAAAEKGYYRVRYSIFEICKTCPYAKTTKEQWEAIENETGRAPGDDDDPFIKTLPVMQPDCSACPRPAYFRDATEGIDPVTGAAKVMRPAYCAGRAAFAENGWIDWETSNGVLKQFDQRPNDEDFEVELCGLRPSSKGYVIRDRDALEDCFVDDNLCEFLPTYTATGGYNRGAGETIATIDWGLAGMCAVTALQNRLDLNEPYGCRVMVDHVDLGRVGITQIVEHLKAWRELYGLVEVWSDSSHPYENLELTQNGFYVRTVTFAKEKELGAGSLNLHCERRAFRAPRGLAEIVLKQLRGWRRNESGQIVKGNDHYCDSLLCGMLKYLHMVTNISATTTAADPRQAQAVNHEAAAPGRHATPRDPVAAVTGQMSAHDVAHVSPTRGLPPVQPDRAPTMPSWAPQGQNAGRDAVFSVTPQPPSWAEQPIEGETATQRIMREARENAMRNTGKRG